MTDSAIKMEDAKFDIYVTIEQAAEILHVTPQTVRKFIKDSALPSYPISKKRILISIEELKEWVESKKNVCM